MVKKNKHILVTFSFIKSNHDKRELAQVPSSAGMFYAFRHPSSISAAWFDRQPLKRWTSRGRYLHCLNKRSPGNSLPENSTRVCWTLEKPIFGSESESVHLSAVSVRLYFKNMTERTHTHTLTMAKKASQLWPSGVDCVKKVPMCRILAFPNMKGISFFLFTEKQTESMRGQVFLKLRRTGAR